MTIFYRLKLGKFILKILLWIYEIVYGLKLGTHRPSSIGDFLNIIID